MNDPNKLESDMFFFTDGSVEKKKNPGKSGKCLAWRIQLNIPLVTNLSIT